MKCYNCHTEIDPNGIYCETCGTFIYYNPVENVRSKLASVIILILIIAFFGWLSFGCKKVEFCSDMRTIPAPKPNPDKSYFKSGEARYTYETDSTTQTFIYRSGCGCRWTLIDSTITKL